MIHAINFIFSGQGAQYSGMMKELHEKYDCARELFNIADETLQRSISDLCFNGSQDELNLTHNTQPCVLAADLASLAVAKEEGFIPNAVAGFSLGEYAALAAADVLSTEDAFRIIQIRADAMQEAIPVGKGAMAAIMKQRQEDIQAFCDAVDGYVIPANINSPAQIVISGENDAVDSVLDICKNRKIRAVKLPVSAPFHCKLMEHARAKLEDLFNVITFHDAKIPVYMNLDGRPHTEAEDIKNCVLKQTVSPVQWVKTIQNMSDISDLFLELGPGNTLTKFVAKINSDAKAAHLEDLDTLNEAKELFGNE